MPSIGQRLQKGGIIFLKRAARHFVKSFQAKIDFSAPGLFPLSYILVTGATQSEETAMREQETVAAHMQSAVPSTSYVIRLAWFVL